MEKFKLVRELSTGFPAFDGEKSPAKRDLDDNSRTNKRVFQHAYAFTRYFSKSKTTYFLPFWIIL